MSGMRWVGFVWAPLFAVGITAMLVGALSNTGDLPDGHRLNQSGSLLAVWLGVVTAIFAFVMVSACQTPGALTVQMGLTLLGAWLLGGVVHGWGAYGMLTWEDGLSTMLGIFCTTVGGCLLLSTLAIAGASIDRANKAAQEAERLSSLVSVVPLRPEEAVDGPQYQGVDVTLPVRRISRRKGPL